LDMDKRKYVEVVKENWHHFVHEIQHWLREEFGRAVLKKRY